MEHKVISPLVGKGQGDGESPTAKERHDED